MADLLKSGLNNVHMKITPSIPTILLCLCFTIEGASTASPPSPQHAAPVLAAQPWRASILDWSSTEWEMTEAITNELTAQVELRHHRYIELADGLNYLDSS